MFGLYLVLVWGMFGSSLGLCFLVMELGRA